MHFVKFTKDGVNSQEKPKSKRVVYKGNPILTGMFVSEEIYIGSGYDQVPLIFKKEADDSWKAAGSLDPGYGVFKQSRIQKGAFGEKTAFFDGSELDESMRMKPRDTLHQNFINCS